jgi:hypothetical protein
VGDGVRPHGEAADGIHLQVPDQIKENLPDEGQPLGVVGGGAAVDIVGTLPAAHQLEGLIRAVTERFLPEEFEKLPACLVHGFLPEF